MNHSQNCKFRDYSVLYWQRKLDPQCPRCQVKIKTGSWPKAQPEKEAGK